MTLLPLVDKAGLSIAYDVGNDWLYVEWKGEQTQHSVRAGCQQMLRCLRQHPCGKILNDNSQVTHATVTLTAWGEQWLHAMQQAGLQYLAWVYAPQESERRQTQAIVRRMECPYVATFDDVAAAYAWLQHQRLPRASHNSAAPPKDPGS